MTPVRAALWALLGVTAMVAAGCGDGPPGGGGGSSSSLPPIGTAVKGAKADVTVQQVAPQKFAPASTTAKVNQVVEWKNGDSTTHNVTFQGHDDITSSSMSQNDTWQVKFTVAGTYQYSCSIHQGMDGTIDVKP